MSCGMDKVCLRLRHCCCRRQHAGDHLFDVLFRGSFKVEVDGYVAVQNSAVQVESTRAFNPLSVIKLRSSRRSSSASLPCAPAVASNYKQKGILAMGAS